MAEQEAGVRNVSDTARWAAYFGGIGTKRPDASFMEQILSGAQFRKIR
jgi:hypothetical protein